MTSPRVAGLMLAAGGSVRFGSPKLLAPLDGVPIARRSLDALLAVEALDPVRVVLGAEAPALTEALEWGRAEPVLCADWTEGMSASLRAGVRAVGAVDWVVVTLADQPGITPQAIAAVVDRALAAPAGVAAVRATAAGAPTHPVALGRAVLARFDSLSGDQGARRLLGDRRVTTVEIGALCDTADVDTPSDLPVCRSLRP